jgi:hypothetical protein
MAEKSHSPKELLAIEEKINSSPRELSSFIKGPNQYLAKKGIELSQDYQNELEEAMREMRKGPTSLDELTRLARPRIGISISIRIRF